jgi:hypothetical protein
MTVALDDYLKAVLRLYTQLPDTPAKARLLDRHLVQQWHSRAIPLQTVEAALLLASARRICRDPAKTPLPQIRSLAYFMPVVEELVQQPLPPNYLSHVRSKITFKPAP